MMIYIDAAQPEAILPAAVPVPLNPVSDMLPKQKQPDIRFDLVTASRQKRQSGSCSRRVLSQGSVFRMIVHIPISFGYTLLRCIS